MLSYSSPSALFWLLAQASPEGRGEAIFSAADRETAGQAAVDAANRVGLPEARLPLADAVILVATSPKSNSAHDAINAAIADVQAGRTGSIPRQLQNKHFDGEDALVKGQNYKYAHSYANHWVQQQYLPDVLKDTKYYTFGDNKTEQAARAYWAKIKGEENV